MIVFYQYFEEEFVRQEIDGELLVAEGVHASSSTAGSRPDLEGDGPKSLPHAHQKPDQPRATEPRGRRLNLGVAVSRYNHQSKPNLLLPKPLD